MPEKEIPNPETLERDLREYQEAPQRRSLTLERKANIDVDARTVELAFSSEEPYQRWFGNEILGHKDGEIDLGRLEEGGAVLVNHDTRDHVGIVEKVWIDGDKGRAVVRFGNSARAAEIFQDVQDGIMRHVSVGYFIRKMELVEEVDDGPNTYRASHWEPFEISVVSVPADTTVGVGKSLEPGAPAPVVTNVISENTKDETMPEENTPPVDVETVENDAREAERKAERKRVSDLLSMAEEYGADDLARQVINSGGDVHDLGKLLLERDGRKVVHAEDPSIGLDEKEIKQFSFTKFLNYLGDTSDASAREAAAFEIECSQAAAEKMRRDQRGSIIPYDVLAFRDMNVGTAIDGGNLVETELLSESFIDSLENALAVRQCGARTLTGLNGNIAIPRQTGGTSHYWLAENGAPTEDAATFDQVAMTPKTVGAYTEISRRLLKQSSIGVENFVRNELTLRLALAIDAAAINGSGASNQPLGILNTGSIGDVAGGANGANPDWDDIVDLETAVAVANAAVGSTKYLTNAKVRGQLKKTFVDSGSNAERVWNGQSNPLNGYDAVVSNQVPSNLVKGSSGAVCSAIIFGNWADLLIGMWGGLDVQVNPYSLDTSGATRITAFQDVDVTVRHPESFAAMQDALTP